MPYCAVRFCGINNMTEDFRKDNITFHRFPNDPALKLKWVQAVRLKKERWYPSYASMVCSLHFKEECFEWCDKRRRLLSTAVPTERLSIPHKLKNLYTKCKTQSSKSGPKCNRQEKPEADNVYDGKLMICKVYRYLEAEYKSLRCYYGVDCDLTPLSNILRRTAEATGVSKKTVTDVLSNKPFIMGKNEASLKPMLDRDCQDPERLNEPAPEFARLAPAPVPLPKMSLPKVPIPKLPTPKAPTAIMPANKRKWNVAIKPPPPPVSLVLYVPVNNAHGVANTAENRLVQHDNPNEHKLNHVYPSEIKPETVVIKEEVINVASDEQYKLEGFTTTDDNIPYTCDVEIPAVKAAPESHDTYGQYYALPMELPAECTSEMLVIKNENTDDELDDINNNIPDFSDKTDEIKMNPADNEIEHMKVSLNNIIWHPAKLPAQYEPRNEFTNYYKNFV